MIDPMQRLLAAGLMLVTLAACGGDDTATKRRIVGTFTIRDVNGDVTTEGKRCTGGDGYEDIRSGTEIRVSDEDGNIIAVGSLKGDGTVGSDGRCAWAWAIPKVPDQSVYGFEVARRGRATYTRDQLKQHPIVILTLG